MATALALPYRTVKHSLLASYSSHFADSGTMLPPGLTSPFLHPQRLPPLLALVLLPWQACWEAQEREVAISLSLWESLLLPVRCLRPLLRRYARCAYPRVRLIELDHGVPLTTLPRCLMAVSTPLRRLEHPHLHGHRIQYSDALHLLVIDETVIPCTPTEYHVLQVLLQRAGEGVSINHLLGRSAQEAVEWHTRRNLTQHISRLRARLWPFDLDILCLIGYGYLLLSRSQEPATAT